MSRDIQFVNGEFYHIIKKGVDNRKIFLDDDDRLRFLNSLLIFNDDKPAPWSDRAFWEQRGPTSLLKSYKPEIGLVEIHSLALMDNHFHLLVKQLEGNGISNFIKKLGGYSYYFNKKYNRVGPLFQGKFKAVLIRTDEQLKNAFVYVNTNPVGLIHKNWKEKGIENFEKAVNFLENYKWSSYPDYLGRENFSSLISKDFFLDLFNGANGCKEEVESWLKYKVEVSKYKNIAI